MAAAASQSPRRAVPVLPGRPRGARALRRPALQEPLARAARRTARGRPARPGALCFLPGPGRANRSARVVELWSARTAALGSRHDVAYVFVFENRGRTDRRHDRASAQPDHGLRHDPARPGRRAFGWQLPLCPDTDDDLLVHPPRRLAGGRAAGALVAVRAADLPRDHVADLPAAGPELRAGLAAMLVDALTRLERLLGPDTPYMLWAHQRPNDGGRLARRPPAPAPGARAAGARRDAGTWPPRNSAPASLRPVDPRQAAAQLRSRAP